MTEIRTPLDARIDELSGVLAEHPEDLAALREYGESNLLRGRVIEAMKCYQRLVGHEPEAADCRLGLAQAYMEAGLAGEASVQVQGVLQAHPASVLGHILLRRLMTAKDGAAPIAVEGWAEFLPERAGLEAERARLEGAAARMDGEISELTACGGATAEPVVEFALQMARQRRVRLEESVAEVAAWERRHQEIEEAERLRLEEEERARLEAEERARLEAEERARLEAEERARLEAEERARLEAEERARLEAEEQARLEAEERARLEAEERARREEEEAERVRLEEEDRRRREAEEAERQRMEEEERLRREEEERQLREAERQRLEEEERLRREEEERLVREAEAAERQRLEEEERLRREAEESERLERERAEAEIRAAEEAAAALVRAREEAYERLRGALDPVVGVLMKTKGVTSVLVVARDGMPVHRNLRDEISLEKVSEFVAGGVAVLNVPDASGQLATWQFWVLEFARGILVLQKITSDYYLVVVGQAGANFGVLTWTIDKNRAQLEDALKGAPPVPTDEPRP